MTSTNTGNMTDVELKSKAKAKRVLEHIIFFCIFLLLTTGLFFMVYRKAKPVISKEETPKSDFTVSYEPISEEASDMEIVSDTAVEEEKPVSYISTLYQAPTALSDNIFECIFELDGHLYRLPCPVSEFLDNGWTVDNYMLTGGNYANCDITLKKGPYRFNLTGEGNRGETEDDFSDFICTSVVSVFDAPVDPTVFRMNKNLYLDASEDDVRNKYKDLKIEETLYNMFTICPLEEPEHRENVSVETDNGRITNFMIFLKADRETLEKFLYTDKYPTRYDYDDGAWDQMEYNDQFVLVKLTHHFADGIVEDTIFDPDIKITTGSWEWNDKNKSPRFVCGASIKTIVHNPDGEWSEVLFGEDGTAKQTFYSVDGEIKETREWQYR